MEVLRAKIKINYNVANNEGILVEKTREFDILGDAMEFIHLLEGVSVTKPIMTIEKENV